MSQTDAAEAPVRLASRVGVYLFLGTIKGVLRDILLFHWSIATIIQVRVLSMIAAVVTIWLYEYVVQYYLDRHRRQWNARAVVFTVGALALLKALPTYAIVHYSAEKPSDLWVGGALVVFTNTMIWCSDRFNWLEWMRGVWRHPLTKVAAILLLMIGLTVFAISTTPHAAPESVTR